MVKRGRRRTNREKYIISAAEIYKRYGIKNNERPTEGERSLEDIRAGMWSRETNRKNATIAK